MDINNNVEYQNLICTIFSTFDINVLNKLIDDLDKMLEETRAIKERIKLNRTIRIIQSYISILYEEMSKNN